MLSTTPDDYERHFESPEAMAAWCMGVLEGGGSLVLDDGVRGVAAVMHARTPSVVDPHHTQGALLSRFDAERFCRTHACVMALALPA